MVLPTLFTAHAAMIRPASALRVYMCLCFSTSSHDDRFSGSEEAPAAPPHRSTTASHIAVVNAIQTATKGLIRVGAACCEAVVTRTSPS